MTTAQQQQANNVKTAFAKVVEAINALKNKVKDNSEDVSQQLAVIGERLDKIEAFLGSTDQAELGAVMDGLGVTASTTGAPVASETAEA